MNDTFNPFTVHTELCNAMAEMNKKEELTAEDIDLMDLYLEEMSLLQRYIADMLGIEVKVTEVL